MQSTEAPGSGLFTGTAAGSQTWGPWRPPRAGPFCPGSWHHLNVRAPGMEAKGRNERNFRRVVVGWEGVRPPGCVPRSVWGEGVSLAGAGGALGVRFPADRPAELLWLCRGTSPASRDSPRPHHRSWPWVALHGEQSCCPLRAGHRTVPWQAARGAAGFTQGTAWCVVRPSGFCVPTCDIVLRFLSRAPR